LGRKTADLFPISPLGTVNLTGKKKNPTARERERERSDGKEKHKKVPHTTHSTHSLIPNSPTHAERERERERERK
jgi:hypothetical protein